MQNEGKTNAKRITIITDFWKRKIDTESIGIDGDDLEIIMFYP